MTTLGTINDLSDNLVLQGLENAPVIAHSQRRTLTGESVVQTAPVVGGRSLALQAENHLTLAQIQAVRELAGQTVTLIHHRGTFTVLVIGIDVEAVFIRSNPQIDMLYSGTINLLEV